MGHTWNTLRDMHRAHIGSTDRGHMWGTHRGIHRAHTGHT